MSALLTVAGLSVRFGGLKALDNVGFAAEAGRITALIGPNGAGKTTAIDCISGQRLPDAGSVTFAGQELLDQPAHGRLGLGLARTFQHLRMFHRMNVLENVMVGFHGRLRTGFLPCMLRLPGVRRAERDMVRRAEAMLEFVGLARQRLQPAGQLAYGDQKKLALARALVAEPRFVLLDEPVAGLNPAESRDVGELIERIRATGVGLLLVEHDMALVMRVSDHVVVLCSGRTIAAGPPREVRHHPEVLAAYLGGGEEFGLHG